jgi:uridine kinase/ribulose-5-phosphate 4-epimerase/fuculose-1-phosphate aldolase
MEKPKVIAVAGPSGVGKTTISRMIAAIYGLEKTLILSGDDLHKWPRNHKKWLQYTHFDPAANFLSLGSQHINLLKRGNIVFRKKYDHNTGDFTECVTVKPKKIIISEGLHSFYSEEDDSLSDLKIYVETEIHLKDKWKIKRDISKRGYSLSEVVDTINRRKSDETKYITPQKKSADAIVMFVEKKGKIQFTYVLKNPKAESLMRSLKDFHQTHQEFIEVSNDLSKRCDITQNKGGNMSYKWGDSLVITSSGSSFDKITQTEGFTYCDLNGLQIFSEQKRPSMEVGVHCLIKEKSILHTHPSYVLALLCSKEGYQIIDELFGGKYTYIDYYCPGSELSNNFPPSASVVFAKNHGLFVGGENLRDCFNKTEQINETIKQFLLKDKKPKYLFPDACVLEEENLFLHGFIEYIIKDSNLTIEYLGDKEVKKILNLEEEKYRKKGL